MVYLKGNSNTNTLISNINVSKLKKEINNKIIGQESAVDSIVNNMFFNQRYFDTGDIDLVNNKNNIIINGAAGTGKKSIVCECIDSFNLPMVSISCELSPEYKKKDLFDTLYYLLDQTEGDIELAERGVIVIEDFSKLEGGLFIEDLLTLLSKTSINIKYLGKKVVFNTSKLTFIGITNYCDNNINSDYLLDKGFDKRIVDCFSCFVNTNELSVKDIASIIKNSTVSPLNRLVMIGKLFGTKIVISSDVIELIAETAIKYGSNAGRLNDMFQIMKDLIIKRIYSGDKKIVITSDYVYMLKVYL